MAVLKEDTTGMQVFVHACTIYSKTYHLDQVGY